MKICTHFNFEIRLTVTSIMLYEKKLLENGDYLEMCSYALCLSFIFFSIMLVSGNHDYFLV